ncbi:protocadherin beta-15-like [Carettochelys insculpta]|uniref:protocadherin beta-15-like n=1 Tax=Carettochelys insculpta TaxID=44489 RepID=UPI003EBF13D2
MAARCRRRQVVCLCVGLWVCVAGAEPLRYSVAEEKKSGWLVANVAKDLQVPAGRLSAGGARLVWKGADRYLELDRRSGDVRVKEKMDREGLCGQREPCLLQLELVLENPLELHRVEVRVEDVNDNSPQFSKNEFVFKIPEQVPVNTRFSLQRAQDPDAGANGIQSYAISSNEHFRLEVQTRADGGKYPELVLQKALDREAEAQLVLILSAADGGVPQRTGTAQVRVDVLDVNDNLPQFSQAVYRAQLLENSPRGTLVSKVEASDPDEGSNAEITYSYGQVPARVPELFQLHPTSGELSVLGTIDFEDAAMYEIEIEATDGGGLSAHCKVVVEIQDTNDNAPEVTVTSVSSTIAEDSAPGTAVALISVRDRDSGENGRTSCSIEGQVPFALKWSLENYYQVVTQEPLDREKVPEYKVSIAARDWGAPRLSSVREIRVRVSDVNDNPPVFAEASYVLRVQENNVPGLLIGRVQAADVDAEQNGQVRYSAVAGAGGELPFSINAESGQVYALRSLDYEERREFEVRVRASDGGSPPLSAEVTVRVAVLDANDNAPFLLCPLQNSSSPGAELVPRWAGAGYLVTKVVAVDEDAGQNSWLSYQLLKATEPGLFAVGVQSGEVRTRRPVASPPDAVKQKLVVVVRDNGEPARSSSATLQVLLVDGFSEAHVQLVAAPPEQEPEDSLTLWLVIALSFISFLLVVSVVSAVGMRLCKARRGPERYVAASRKMWCAPQLGGNPAEPSGAGTLPESSCSEVCLSAGSGASEFKFLRPLFPPVAAERSAAGGPVLGSQLSSRVKGAEESPPEVSADVFHFH